jgi:hypothetical protein
MAIELQVQGQDKVLRVFRALPSAIQRKIIRPTFQASGREVAKVARLNLRRNKSIRSGLLAKSMGSVVRIARNGTVSAHVGPRRSITGSYMGKRVIPWKYAHLVEKGGRGGKMPARPFLQPAFDSSKGRIYAAARKKMEQRLAGEVAKLSGIQRSIIRA